ncbi:conserved exported protein of unknown function [Burkholderia multivorans]
MYKTLITIVAGLALAACTTTRDGVQIGVGTQPNASQVQKLRNQLGQNVQSTVAKKAAAAALKPENAVGIVLVGSVGPLRKVEPKDRPQLYVAYAKDATKWHPDHEPYLSESEFVAQMAGWTTMETFSIPGMITLRQPALVQDSDVDNITFASTFASFMVGATGDLVAAKSNSDGVMVIEKVLCKDANPDYRTCAAQFEKGHFDANTGAELDRAMKPKQSGVHIDPATFKVIHSAG